MANVKPTDVVNAVINASPTLRGAVPMATALSLQETGGALLKYTPFMNEFLSGLVNRILYQEVRDATYNNPLRIFKGADVPYGTDVQDSIANPAVATAYDSTALSDVLTPQSPDVKTVYYRRNRQDKYKVTIWDAQLKGAFINPDAFMRLYAAIRNTLVNGDNIDEYRLMVSTLADPLDNGNIVTKELTKGAMTDEEFYRQVVRNLREYFLMFGFPSTAYNSYKKMADAAGVAGATDLTTWTTPDRISVILRADVAAATDVEVLAKAFNMDKTDFLGRQVIVDSFGEGETAKNTLAIICDNTAIRTHDNLYQMADTPYNAAALCRTWYLHHWETMAYSPLANAVAITQASE